MHNGQGQSRAATKAPGPDLSKQALPLRVVYPGLDGLPGVGALGHDVQEAARGIQRPWPLRGLGHALQDGAHQRLELAQPLPAGCLLKGLDS